MLSWLERLFRAPVDPDRWAHFVSAFGSAGWAVAALVVMGIVAVTITYALTSYFMDYHRLKSSEKIEIKKLNLVPGDYTISLFGKEIFRKSYAGRSSPRLTDDREDPGRGAE